jgi:acyl dehydratase
MEPPSAGRCYEDFEAGTVLRTAARTITAQDIRRFARLSGDHNDVHRPGGPFGEPVAHGTLVLAISSGLVHQLGINQGTLLAFVGADHWRLHKPVRAGDTIQVELHVKATRPSRDPGRGLVTFHRRVLDGSGDLVQEIDLTVLYRRRPGAASAGETS